MRLNIVRRAPTKALQHPRDNPQDCGALIGSLQFHVVVLTRGKDLFSERTEGPAETPTLKQQRVRHAVVRG